MGYSAARCILLFSLINRAAPRAFFVSILLVILGLNARAQTPVAGSAAVLTSVSRSDFDVCLEARPNVLRLTNNGTGTMAPLSMTLVLSPGAAYEVGSVSVVAGSATVSEVSVSDPRNPVFSLSSLAPGNSVDIRYRQRFGCDVIPYRDAGNLIVDNVRLTYTIGGTSYVQNLTNNSSSNVRSAVLSVLNVSNAAYTGSVGETFVQSVTLTNGGLGYVTGAGLNLGTLGGVSVSGASVGTLTTTGSGTATAARIDLPASAFGADGQWTNGETVVVSYSVTINSCNNLQRSLTLFWGCGSPATGALQTCQTSSPPYPVGISLTNTVPNVVAAVQSPALATCQLDVPISVTVTFTNTGTGPATNLNTLDIYQSSASVPITYAFSMLMQVQTMQLTLPNGTTAPASTTVVQTVQSGASLGNGTAGCYTGSPRYVRVGVPEGTLLQPGQRIAVIFDITACQNTVCGGSFSTGNIGARLSYASQCQSATFTTPAAERGVIPSVLINTSTLQAPAQVQNGDEFNVSLETTLSSNIATTLNDYVDFSISLPNGFSYVSGSLVEQGANLAVASGYPQQQNGQLIIRYLNPPGGGTMFVAPRIRLKVNQTTCTGGSFALATEVRYYLDGTCPTPQYARACQSGTVLVTCPGCTEGGLVVQNFYFRRVTLGQPDNNRDGRPDASGSVNTALIQLDRYRPGDVMQASSKGVIAAGATLQKWGYVYAEWAFNQGTWNAEGNGSVVIKRISGPGAFSVTCPNVPLLTVVAGKQYKLDWSAVSGCLPTNYNYEPGDSILVDARFRMVPATSASGASINTSLSQNVATTGMVTQLFYATQTAGAAANPGGGSGGPNRWQCGPINYNYYMLGMQSYASFNGSRTFSGSCTPLNTAVNLYNALLSRSGGGQYFPYEYRPMAIPDEVSLRLPVGYAVVAGQNNVATSTFTTKANSSSAVSLTISPTITGNVATGYTLSWNLKALVTGGQLFIGTEGYNLTLPFQLLPTCSALDNASAYPTYLGRWFDFPSSNQPQSFSLAQTSATALTYNSTLKPALNMVAPLPSVLTTTSTASWTVALQNVTNNAAANSFMRVRVRNNYTAIVVTDLTSNTVVSPDASGLYRLGTTAAAATRNYRITATLGQCASDNLVLDYGWDCTGYPTDLSAYACAKSLTISAQGNPAGLDATFSFIPGAPDGTVRLCEPVSFTTTINSTQVGSLKEVLYTVDLPDGLNYVPGSLTYVFPTTGTPTVSGYNPTIVGRQLRFQLTQIAPATALSAGLSGVGTNQNRTVRLYFQGITQCGFPAGSVVRAGYSGTAVCGDELPTLAQTSAPVNISGVTTTSRFTIRANTPALLACGPSQTLSVSATQQADMPTGSNEELVVTLPPMVQYVPGSAVPSNVTVVASGGNTLLHFPLPAGIGSGQAFTATLGVQSSTTFCQAGSALDFETRQVQSVNCGGNNCNTPVRSGSLLQVPIDIRKANLSFTTANLSLTAVSTTQETGSLTLVVTNAASTTANPTTTLQGNAVVDIINDLNRNGSYDTGEPTVATAVVGAGLAPGGSTTVVAGFALPTGICALVARINPGLNTCNCSVAERAIIPTGYNSGAMASTVCTGQPVGIGATAVPDYQYTWSGLEGTSISTLSSLTVANPVFVTSLPGSYGYQVQVTRAAGCTPLSQTVTVVVNEPASLTVNSLAVCTGQPGSLTVLGCGGALRWNTGATTSIMTVAAVTATTFYSVTCTSGPCSATAQSFITANPSVTATISGSTTFCTGQSTTLTAGGGSTFRWSANAGNATTQLVTVGAAGVYSVTALGEGGCSDVKSTTVTTKASPVLTLASQTSCAGSAVTLTLNGCSGGSINWSANATTAASLSIAPLTTTMYPVTCTVANGCSAGVSSTVTVRPTPAFYAAPTATPATCAGGTANSDARLDFSALQNVERADLVAGTTYAGGPAYSTTGNVVPASNGSTLRFGGLTNPNRPRTYTVRLFGPGGTCFADVPVTLNSADCHCPAPGCAPVALSPTR